MCPLRTSSPRVLEVLFLRRRVARHEDVDGLVDGLVVVAGYPRLSHRQYCVVWTREMMVTSLLIAQARYCPSAHMNETCIFMEEVCMV